MLTRYRIVAVVLGIVVILVIGWGVYSTGHLRGEQAGEYQANSDTYRRHAEQEIRKTCAGLNGNAQTDCIIRVVEATNQHERAESDLKAQHSMALWALWMLVVTAAMAFITAFGVYYVWRTLLATQDMAVDTRRIGEAQTRAYLSIVSVSGVLDSSGGTKLLITIKNTGSSPAYNMRTFISTQVISDYSEKRVFFGDAGGFEVRTDLGAGETRTLQTLATNYELLPIYWTGSGVN